MALTDRHRDQFDKIHLPYTYAENNDPQRSLQTNFNAGPEDPYGNFTSIGDEYFLDFHRWMATVIILALKLE